MLVQHKLPVLHTALEYGMETLGWLRLNPAAAVRSAIAWPTVTHSLILGS